MRIAQVCPYFYPKEGGMERHVLNLSLELKKKGHDIEIFTTYDHSKVLSYKEDLQINRYRPLFMLGDFASFWPGFIFDLLKGKFDLIHVHAYRHPHTDIAMIISKYLKIPCILTAHSPFHNASERRNKLVDFYDKHFAKETIKNYDAIIVLNKEEKKFFDKYGAKTVQIPNGLAKEDYTKGDASRFRKKYSIKKNQKILLCVGRLHKSKGFHRLSKLRLPHNTQLVIAGKDAGYGSQLKRILPNAVFTDQINHEELKDAYLAAEILLVPSNYEAFGIVILEAMAQGLPIIATNKGGPKEIIKKDFGFCISPDKMDKWNNTINKLLNDPNKIRNMGLTAKKEAEKYRWKIISDKIIQTYSKTLKK